MAIGFNNNSQNVPGRLQPQPFGWGIGQRGRQQQVSQTQQNMRQASWQSAQQPQQPHTSRNAAQQGVKPHGARADRATQAPQGNRTGRAAEAPQGNRAGRATGAPGSPMAGRTMQTPPNMNAQRGNMQQSKPGGQSQARAQPTALPDKNNLPDGVTYQPLDDRTMAEIGAIAPNHPAVVAFRQNQHQQNQQGRQGQQNAQGQQGTQGRQNAQNQQPPKANQLSEGSQPAAHTAQIQPMPQPALPQLLPLNQNGTLNEPSAPAFPGIMELPPPVSEYGQILEKLMQNERNGAAFYEQLVTIAETKAQANTLRKIGEGCMERKRSYNELYRRHTNVDFNAIEHTVMGAQTLRQGISLALTEEESVTRELIKLYESAADAETRHVLSAQLYKKISDLVLLYRLVAR